MDKLLQRFVLRQPIFSHKTRYVSRIFSTLVIETYTQNEPKVLISIIRFQSSCHLCSKKQTQSSSKSIWQDQGTAFRRHHWDQCRYLGSNWLFGITHDWLPSIYASFLIELDTIKNLEQNLCFRFQTKRKERTVETQALEQELLAEGKYQVAKQGIQWLFCLW